MESKSDVVMSEDVFPVPVVSSPTTLCAVGVLTVGVVFVFGAGALL
jgi:hypothetical protein